MPIGITQVTVNLPYPASVNHTVNVIDAAVLPTDKIMPSLAGVPDTQINSGGMLDVLSMEAFPKTGSFDFILHTATPSGGPVVINYMRTA